MLGEALKADKSSLNCTLVLISFGKFKIYL